MTAVDRLGVAGSLRMGVVASAVAGLVVAGGTFALWSAAQADSARATAHVVGAVTEVVGDDQLDVRVGWTDPSGAGHESAFSLDDRDDARVGAPFALRFDPEDPGAATFPAVPGSATGPGEDAASTGALGTLVASAFLVGVLERLRRNRRALAATRTTSPVPMILTVQEGRAPLARCTYAALSKPRVAPPAGRRSRWRRVFRRNPRARPIDPEVLGLQAVVWEPVLETLCAVETPVLVHGDLDKRRRVVITLPNGHRLTPHGRLRRHPPLRWTSEPRKSPSAPARRGFLTGLRRTPWTVGPAIGLGLLAAGPAGAAIAAPYAALLTVTIWVLNGAEPHRPR